MKIYYNPSCSKCRSTLTMLNERQEDEPIEVIEYLTQTPSRKELKDLLVKLKMKAQEILRRKEPAFLENYSQLDLNDEDKVLEALVKHPIFIERPIVIRGDRAVIGRPPENIAQLWD